MIVRFAVLLLALLIVAAMISRWRKRLGRSAPPRPIEAADRCPDCGAYVVTARPGPCDRPGCRFRAA